MAVILRSGDYALSGKVRYFVESTPATVPEHQAHKDAPPLPPLPESVMTQVAHHPGPKFPWRFLLSFLISFPLLWMLAAHGLGR